jgi:rare lipoprotein A
MLTRTLCRIFLGAALLAALWSGDAAARLADAPSSIAKPAPRSQALQTGPASWYGPRHHGRRTASGEVFDMNALSAAHPSLPFGTRLLVTNVANGRSVKVRVNDRGPHRRGFVLDLSRAAAKEIGLGQRGIATVSMRRV